MFLQIMKAATRANLGTLRQIVFGGEGFPKLKLKQLFDELGPQTELHNVYGPTECTCICSSYKISVDDFRDAEGFAPLGHLAGHFTQHLLNENTPAPPGESGELCLGGCCVGLGYFNQPDHTAAAFVQNPINGAFREIIYRTGDLARLDPTDGKLNFVGRRDLQVKHMGYRIELEEIQHAIMTISGIDDAAVFHRRKDDLSEIIAVVSGQAALNAKLIRYELAARIPKYMMPSKFHILERMPKNPNGKTDRPALAREYAS
jgi:D-alanine--poly(phosphoribitol) ligase subunit 1